jgi:hypothetical protein
MNSTLSLATRCCGAAISCGCAAAALAQVPVPIDRRGHAVIDNCVAAAQLSFKPGVNGIVLDERDGAEVAQAIVRRYPMIERDGLYPQAVALWRPPKGEWVYATLSQKKHAPHPVCFTATVDAAQVDATPTLIRKYFGPAP